MPRPLPASTKRKRLAEASYKSLLKTVRDGRAQVDPRTGQYARDSSGKIIYTPATASDHAQARLMCKELAAAAKAEESNPYADAALRKKNLKAGLTALGYTDTEAQAIIERKRETSEYDNPE